VIHVLAATVSTDAAQGVTETFLKQGPAGAIALVAIGVFWVAWRRESARADAERAAKDALVKEFLDKVVPALTEATRTQREFVDQARRDR
jgi:hypothetical protein